MATIAAAMFTERLLNCISWCFQIRGTLFSPAASNSLKERTKGIWFGMLKDTSYFIPLITMNSPLVVPFSRVPVHSPHKMKTDSLSCNEDRPDSL